MLSPSTIRLNWFRFSARNLIGLLTSLLIQNVCAQSPLFSDVTNATGVSFVSDHNFYGNGLSTYDWNKDGYPDLSFASTWNNPAFYLNLEGSGFTEVVFPGIENSAEAKSIQWIDYNNDTYPDLFITRSFAAWSLYKNDGSFNFIDVTNSIGLGQQNYDMIMGSCWADIDLNGWLDVYICNYSQSSTNKLFLNNGGLSFTNVSISSGTSDGFRPSFQAVFADFNMDGLPDLHVGNDRTAYPNTMYLNEGAGVFQEISSYAGIDIMEEAMSNTIGDFDNDGDLDIYVSNSEAGNYLLLNNGDSTFINIAFSAGVEINEFCWGAQWIDQDLDGNLDLFVGTHTLNPGPSTYNHILLNNNNSTFSEPDSTGFSGEFAISFASAIADVDKDGDMDIVVSSDSPGQAKVWQNNNDMNSSLTVSLEGTVSNKDGIGAVVRCYVNGELRQQDLRCGEAHLAQNSQYLIFGKGSEPLFDSITVSWPSGIVDHLYNVSSSWVHVIEGSTSVTVSVQQSTHQSASVINLNGKVSISGGIPINLTLYDINGKIMVSSNKNHIDLSQHSAGVYVLRALLNDGELAVFKITTL